MAALYSRRRCWHSAGLAIVVLAWQGYGEAAGYVQVQREAVSSGQTLRSARLPLGNSFKYGAGYISSRSKSRRLALLQRRIGPESLGSGSYPTDATLVAPVSQLTVKELKELAAERGIEVSPRARKAELIEILSRE